MADERPEIPAWLPKTCRKARAIFEDVLQTIYQRNATAGSTRVARRAGIMQAEMPDRHSSPVVTARTSGSAGR